MKAKAFALNDILPPITGNVFEGIKTGLPTNEQAGQADQFVGSTHARSSQEFKLSKSTESRHLLGTTTPRYFYWLIRAATDHLPCRECTLHREKPQTPNDSLSNPTVNGVFSGFLSFLEYLTLPAPWRPDYRNSLYIPRQEGLRTG